jgi:hypothetical protein
MSRVLSAPLNTGVIQRRLFGLRFDKAPAHDEFPEGGLRIVGVLPSADGNFTEAKDTTYGLFSGGTLACAAINPCGAFVTATTSTLFLPTSPLAVFAQYFRKFRFRRVALDVTSEVPPGAVLQSGGAGLVLQVAHERDIVTAEQSSTSYTIDTAVVSNNCTRFAAWTANIVCPVISEQRHDRADELWFCSGAGDSQAASGDAALRQTHQGAVTALGSILNGTGALVVSKVLVDFVVDLYGFTNITTGVIPSRRMGEKKCTLLVKSNPDEKDPDGEFIDLSPKSNRSYAGSVRESARPVDGSVRESARPSEAPASRPPSLKGTRV